MLDILNEDGSLSGQQRERGEVHMEGLLHACVWLWVHDGRGRVLLQQRANDPKRAHPGQWDIAAGGHVEAGSTVEDAALCEAAEELGLKIDASRLDFVDRFKIEAELDNPTPHTAREYITVYLVEAQPEEISEIQAEEVAQVKWLDIAEFEKDLQQNPDNYAPHDDHKPDHYGKMIKAIKTAAV